MTCTPMLNRSLYIVIALIFYASTACAGGLPPSVTQALKAAAIPLSAVAVVVQATDARSARWTVNANKAMNPASTMKLLTTFVALDTLGPAYRWQTRAWVDGTLREGVLHGNLYLQGGGDPKFTYEQLWRWLREMRQRGLREIRGDVVLDSQLFWLDAKAAAAFDEYPLRPYNVAPNALLLNFNTLSLRILPPAMPSALASSDAENAPAPPPQLLSEPPLQGLTIVNQLHSEAQADCGEWRERLTVGIEPGAAPNVSDQLILDGAYPLACGEQSWHIGLPDHARFMQYVFTALWAELGGQMRGHVRTGVLPAEARLFAVSPAPTFLGDIVRDINKYSNNVMARQLLLTLGAASGSQPAQPADGANAIQNWLRQRNLGMPELVIENGAGLSRVERLSAASMNRLLQFAWRSAMMPELVASLPLAGVDGTMKKRLQNEGITGQAHIKTGTLDGVKSMAGYVRDQCGRYWVVVFMVNHPNAAQAGMAMDALLQTVWAQDKRSKAKISSHPFMQPVHSSDHAQTPNADD
jgi:D-alanyl-D-alanine carboxypeptidase/D-alanyl-D-alanine-endopeptidase (penicillin-binding protein 4)